MKMRTQFIIFGIFIIIFYTACSSMGPKPPGSKDNINPEDALFQKAEALYDQKKFDQAITSYLEYMSRYPDGAMIDAALLKLGIAHGELEKEDQALNYLEQLIVTFPNSPLAMDARIEILSVYLRQGRFRQVEQNAEDILEQPLHDSQRIKVYGILADTFVSNGQYFKAVQYYDKMLQLTSQKSRLDVFDKVQFAVDQLSMEQTKQLLSSLSNDGARSHLLYHLGKMHFADKKFTKSETTFKELLTEYPEFKENEEVTQILKAIASGEAFKPYTMGCLLPLSGSYAAYGQRALRGIEMALIHFSQKVSGFMPSNMWKTPGQTLSRPLRH